MKRNAPTSIKQRYVLEYFELKKVFDYELSVSRYDRLYWEKSYMVGAGCYKKLLSYTFESHAKLIAFLKTWYPKDYVVWFNHNISAALKQAQNAPNGIVIIRSGENTMDKSAYVLKQKKKKQAKKHHRRYWCDCYHCTGMPREVYAKQQQKDEKKLA